MNVVATNALTDTPQVVVGKIVDVTGPRSASGGYPSGTVRYTIVLHVPGAGTVTLAGQSPTIKLWNDLQDVDARRLLNKNVPGVMVARNVEWHFYEPPTLSDCAPAPAARGSIRSTIGNGPRTGTTPPGSPDLPPVDMGTSDAPAGPGNAPGGGEE